MSVSPSPQPFPVGPSASNRLNSWKEIASHLNATVRTVQRWEKNEQLPVHRHLHSERPSVYAFRSELDHWWSGRGASFPSPVAAPSIRRWWTVAAVLGLLAAAFAALALLRPVSSTPRPTAGAALAESPGTARRLDSVPTAPAVSDPAMVPRSAVANRARPAKAVPLTSYPGDELYPTFSPDATQVAFCWNGENQNNMDVYVKVVGNTDAPLRITTDRRPDIIPAWSPDGRTIAFLRWQGDGTAGVMLIPPLGGGAERKLGELLIGQPGNTLTGPFLAWSPDSKWLVVAGGVARTQPPILLNVGTGERRELLPPAPELSYFVHPAFSRNGRTLAFGQFTRPGLSQIFLMDLTADFRPAGSPRQLTAESDQAGAPVWSSDGREILFLSGSDPNAIRLWKVGATGGNAEEMEFGYTPVDTVAAAGKRLAFSHRRTESDIWRTDLEASGNGGESPAKFLSSSRLDDYPQFSPDGSRIAFRSTRSGNWEIHVANRDGSNTFQLTSFGGPSLAMPRWSPDGKRLAFFANVKGAATVYSVEAAGGTPSPLKSGPTALPFLNWSRDGKWIYFVSRRTGKAQSWKAPLGGGPAVQVTREGGYAARESADGKFVYYLRESPTGPPGLWRVPVEGGEETLVTDRLEWQGTVDFTGGGIYFITAQGRGMPAQLRFFNFTSGTSELVAPVPNVQRNGFSVSPDRRTFLYSKPEPQSADLILVEGFR